MNTTTAQPAAEAHAELNTLIQTLHEQGLLRLANDLAASHPQWMHTLGGIVDDSLRQQNAAQLVPALTSFGQLLVSLDEQGLLQLANNAVTSQAQWGHTLRSIIDDALEQQPIDKLLSALTQFSQLLLTLHEQGLLQLANDAAASHEQWTHVLAEIVDDTLEQGNLHDVLPALREAARVVVALHEQGLLRMAGDAITSHEQWIHTLNSIVDAAFADPQLRTAMQNARVAFEALLGRVDPDAMRKLLVALAAGLDCAATYKPDADRSLSPGLFGAYRLANDESLWRTLAPILEAVRVVGANLAEQPRMP